MTMSLVRLLVRAVVVGALLLPRAERAATEPRQPCDLPAGEAPATLRLFSDHFGKEVLFAADIVRGVRTNAVHGDYTAREALDRMFAGTDLAAVSDERSGALAVSRKRPPVPGKPPAAKARAPAAPAAGATDRVVKLEEFKVGIAIGSYAEVMSTAGNKTPMSLRDLASTIQMLNASFISDTRAQSLEDLYPYVIGMARESTAAVGFTLRGFSSNTSLTMFGNVQVDGLPGLGSRYGSPTTANVERVEVLKGPVSVLYGQMAPGGVINVETKRPSARAKTTLFSSASSFAGAHSPFGEDAGFSTVLDTTGAFDGGKRFLYRLIANYETADSFRQNSTTANYDFFPSFTWRVDAATEVTLQGEFIRERRFSDGFLVAPFFDTTLVAPRDVTYQKKDSPEYDRGDDFGLSAQHRFANQWEFKFNVRDVQHRDGRKLLENRDVVSATPVAASEVQRRYRHQFNRRRYAYLDANLHGDLGSGVMRHTVLLGASFGYETHDFIRWAFSTADVANVNLYAPDLLSPYPSLAGGPTQDAVSQLYNYGVYATDQIAIGRRWRASVGLRHEKQDAGYRDWVSSFRFSQSLDTTVPSLGAVYQPNEALSFYASYAEGFKPSVPQTTDARGHHFPAEKAAQLELGLKADLLDNKVTALVAAYSISRRHVIEQVAGQYFPNGVAIYQLFGEQRSEGVEASVTYQPLPHWQFQAGYTYFDARAIGASDPIVVNARLENAPRNSGHFWTRYNFSSDSWRGFGVGLGVTTVGQRNGITTNNPAQKLSIAGYTKVENAFYYDWKRYSFAVNISNTLDQSYILSADAATDVVPGPPRKITASVRCAF